jgi:hypothetical protein
MVNRRWVGSATPFALAPSTAGVRKELEREMPLLVCTDASERCATLLTPDGLPVICQGILAGESTELKSRILAKILFGFEIEPDGVVENHHLRAKSTRIPTTKQR